MHQPLTMESSMLLSPLQSYVYLETTMFCFAVLYLFQVDMVGWPAGNSDCRTTSASCTLCCLSANYIQWLVSHWQAMQSCALQIHISVLDWLCLQVCAGGNDCEMWLNHLITSLLWSGVENRGTVQVWAPALHCPLILYRACNTIPSDICWSIWDSTLVCWVIATIPRQQQLQAAWVLHEMTRAVDAMHTLHNLLRWTSWALLLWMIHNLTGSYDFTC